MSNDWKGVVARRPLLAALCALAGIGAAGGIAYEASNLPVHKGAYEDLTSLLPDRENAEVVGRAVLAGDGTFRAREEVQGLRRKIGQRPLFAVLVEDAVQGRVAETQGWVLPQTLTELCALAAKAA